MRTSERDTVVKLKEFQDRFVFSEKRYPAMVGGWGVGKDLCSITRGMDQSMRYKNNLGLIARLEATDLMDSTIRDFKLYTGLNVDSHRDAKLQNGSEFMFRHLEELTENNLNNMNLGWFCLIQADEIETDSIFIKLTGRLRRCHGCKKQINPVTGKLECLCKQTGFISANVNGEDWIARLWGSGELGLKGTLEDAELIEASTMQNADVLPVAYINSLDEVRRNRPEMYERFVLNSRKVSEDRFVVLPYNSVRGCVNAKPLVIYEEKKRITVCDPAEGDVSDDENMGEGGGDETVIYDFDGPKIADQEIYNHISLTDTMSKIIIHAKKNGSNLICVDKVGIGAKLYSDLVDVYKNDGNMTVYGFDGRLKAPDQESEETYANYKTYAWFKARDKFFNNIQCSVPNDLLLIRQLSKVRYRYTSGVKGGKYMLLPKLKIKQMLGCSPDRADAYIMGLDALTRAVPLSSNVPERKKSWTHPAYQTSGIQKNPYEGKAIPANQFKGW